MGCQLCESRKMAKTEFFDLQDLIESENDPVVLESLIRKQTGYLESQLKKFQSCSVTDFYREQQLDNLADSNIMEQASVALTSGVVKLLKKKNFTLCDARNNSEFQLDSFSFSGGEKSSDRDSFPILDEDPQEMFDKFISFSAELDNMNKSFEISRSFTTPKVPVVEEKEIPIDPFGFGKNRKVVQEKVEEEIKTNPGFTSARYEYMVQQSKKNGGHLSNNDPTSEAPLFAYGNGKKTLGGRRGGRNLFVPPVRSNSCE